MEHYCMCGIIGDTRMDDIKTLWKSDESTKAAMKGRRSLVKTNKTCANCAFSQEVHQKHEKIRIATCMIGQVNALAPKIQSMKRN